MFAFNKGIAFCCIVSVGINKSEFCIFGFRSFAVNQCFDDAFYFANFNRITVFCYCRSCTAPTVSFCVFSSEANSCNVFRNCYGIFYKAVGSFAFNCFKLFSQNVTGGAVISCVYIEIRSDLFRNIEINIKEYLFVKYIECNFIFFGNNKAIACGKHNNMFADGFCFIAPFLANERIFSTVNRNRIIQRVVVCINKNIGKFYGIGCLVFPIGGYIFDSVFNCRRIVAVFKNNTVFASCYSIAIGFKFNCFFTIFKIERIRFFQSIFKV